MDLEATRAVVADIRNMQLRNGSVVGGSTGTLSTSGRELFEEGVALVFERWTAVCLAIEQQWGGQNSADKAQDLYSEVLQWFLKNTVHYADDLENLLSDQLLADFNAQIEDGSPREVAKQLVALHHDLVRQQTGVLECLRAAAPSGSSASRAQRVDLDGAIMDEDSGDTSFESGSDEDMQDAPPAASKKDHPVVDDDGFQLVQSRNRRN